MLTPDEIQYYQNLAEEIGEELDAFNTFILPAFLKRGYSVAQALAFHSNKQVIEAIDCLSIDIERVSGDDDREEKKPWET